jgi:flagellar protein FliJ
MAKPSVIDTLIELTSQKSEEAAKALSMALQQQKQSAEKLSLLTQYKSEYMVRLDKQLRDGLSVKSMVNFQNFLNDLDLAVLQQQRAHNADTDAVKTMQRNWQELERKKLSYSTLADRASAKLLAKANKQEQKLMDEMASRSHRIAR